MNNQRGFLALGLTGYALLGCAAVIAVMSVAVSVQTARLNAAKAELATFRAGVEALGKAAEVAARATEAKDKANKQRIDNENQKLRADVAALSGRLRLDRSRQHYLPPASPGAAQPHIASLNRADTERAIQRLDAGISGLIAEGDGAIVDLNSGRKWAAER